MAVKIDPGFAHDLPALRGVQAGREYFVTMCPLKIVTNLLKVNEDDISPELRAQRVINKSRVPALAQYIVENRNSYLFSSLTASVDGDAEFTPVSKSTNGQKMGVLRVSMESKWLINDGQHRRAAIDLALKDDPSLGEESISIVIFIDRGLKRSQQMFADLNRFAVRPTKSLGILYDHRDPVSKLCQDLTKEVRVFRGKVEKAKSTISNRSQKLFTLSGIYQATRRLIGIEEGAVVSSEGKEIVVRFWNAVGKNMPDWVSAVKKEVSPKELRTDYVHAHGIALQALAIAGAALIAAHPNDWEKRLVKIKTIDWARENAELWEGRAMIGGQINKSLNCQLLTANVIKKHLKLPLNSREQEAEDNYAKGKGKK